MLQVAMGRGLWDISAGQQAAEECGRATVWRTLGTQELLEYVLLLWGRQLDFR